MVTNAYQRNCGRVRERKVQWGIRHVEKHSEMIPPFLFFYIFISFTLLLRTRLVCMCVCVVITIEVYFWSWRKHRFGGNWKLKVQCSRNNIGPVSLETYCILVLGVSGYKDKHSATLMASTDNMASHKTMERIQFSPFI